MTGSDDRPLRSRLADRLPYLTALSLLAGLIELVDLSARMYSRAVGRRPTPTARDASTVSISGALALPRPPTVTPAVTTTTTTSAAHNVVRWRGDVDG